LPSVYTFNPPVGGGSVAPGFNTILLNLSLENKILNLLRKVIITGLTDHNVLIFNPTGPKAGGIENPVNQIFSLYLLF
jgi:hypothetical protein